MADIESTVVLETKYKDNNVSQQLERLGSIVNGLSNQIERFDNTVLGFSKDFKAAAGSINNAAQAMASGYSKMAKSTGKEVDELEQTRKAIDRVGAQANRFVSSNIMAQFQDVFVSAQMGMKPFTIALQQGTQLMAAFAQSKAPLADLVAGFKALVGPVAILTVGLTGLAAASIQMVDWVSVGKTALNGLAAGFEFVAKNSESLTAVITALGVTLITFNSKAIGSAIVAYSKLGWEAVKTGSKMAAAWLTGMGPLGLFITGILAVEAVWLAFGDKIKKFFTGDFAGYVKAAVNGFLNTFTAAILAVYESVKWAWEQISRLWGGEGPQKSFMDSVNGAVDFALRKDTLGEVQKELNNTDNVAGKIFNGLGAGASAVANKLKDWSTHLGESEKKSKKIHDYWADIVRNANQSIADKQLEASLLGKPEFQKTYEQTLQSLMQQAEDKGIDLNPDKINQLEQLATQTARVTEETNKLTEAYTESKSIFKGFFSDMRQGLLDGESAWVSFGNAVLNVLNKIQEKLMDKTTDLLFDALWNVGSAYFSAPSTTGGSTAEVNRLGDLGASVGRKPVMAAANGGVFSNGVYESPTLFKFAKGGRFGVMGEAGPEAVMPLRRGPDGSLGVRADGVGGSPVIVNIVNNSNAQARTEQRQTSQGVELDVMIDNLVADKMGKNGSASNNALKAFSSQSLVMR